MRKRVVLYREVRTVLLYGVEIWVVAGEMLKVMEGFNNQVDSRIVAKTDLRAVGGEW